MKKSAKRLIALAAVLVVLIAGLIAVKSCSTGESSEKGSDKTVPVGSLSGTITEISFTGNDGELLSFINKDGKWLCRETEALPLQQSYIERIAAALSNLTASKSIKLSDTLAAYGFEPPVNTITAADSAGKKLTLLIGKDITEGCYAMEKDGDTVYVIGTTLPGYLDINLNSITEQEEIPAVTEKEADSVTLSGSGRTLQFTKVRKANGSGIWYMGADDTGTQAAAYEIGDKTAKDYLDTVLKAIESPKFNSLVKYFPSDEDLEVYGLDSPAATLQINYRKDDVKGSYTLYIGYNADDYYYYASLEGSDAVYLISANTASALISALDAFSKNL